MVYKEITAEDGNWARPLLQADGFRSSEFCFVNIYMWGEVFHTKIARFKDFVIARSEGKKHLHYLYPPGTGDRKQAIDAILEDAAEQKMVPILFSLTQHEKNWLEKTYPGRFIYDNPRGDSDYIYLSSDLANLPGKKYQKKRNHCSRFERSYPNWQFHEIKAEVMQQVCDFNTRWSNLYDNRDDEGIAKEYRAIQRICNHYDELFLKGGYITIDDEIVAFSFGSPLGKDTFVTHVEKALYDVAGAYNVINREMARRYCQEYTYINRENDLNVEGLRRAKLSYNPEFLEEKYTAELIL